MEKSSAVATRRRTFPLPRSSGLPELDEDLRKQMPPAKVRRSWKKTAGLQLFTLLWVVPVITLLVLNFEGYFIGASAWCAFGDCTFNVYGDVYDESGNNPFDTDTSVAVGRLAHFDRESHNLLGALQLVAKAIEIWFAFIVTLLVYLLTFKTAASSVGLPVFYITRASEYAEVSSFLDPKLWTSMIGITQRSRIAVVLFVLCTGLLGILCNFMGPGIAVLALPTINWTTSKQYLGYTFDAMNSTSPPNPIGYGHDIDNAFGVSSTCTSADIMEGKFSCSADSLGFVLDSWVSAYASSKNSYWTNYPAVSYQLQLSFTMNTSSPMGEGIVWTPSRPVLNTLGVDLRNLEYVVADAYEANLVPSADVQAFRNCNKSMQTSIHHYGPILGATNGLWAGGTDLSSPWNIDVDHDRQIRCYANYSLDCPLCFSYPLWKDYPLGHYTKCIQIGTGWGSTTANTTFSIPRGGGANKNDSTLTDISVNIYSSDRAVFIPNGALPWLPAQCLQSGAANRNLSCDWDRLFAVDPMSPTAHRSIYHNTWEFSVSNASISSYQTVDFVALLNFTDYQFDPSPLTNPQYLVRTLGLPSTGTPIPVHPWWALAAWAVDANGSLPLNRTVAAELTDSFYGYFEPLPRDDWNEFKMQFYSNERESAMFVPLAQMLSMIAYTTNETTHPETDSLHPAMSRTIHLYGWSYGLKSRTSYLGATVAIAGILICIVQLILGLIDLRPYRSLTHILVSALEHVSKGEFTAAAVDRKETDRVCFNVKDCDTGAGKLKFSFRPRC